MGQLEDSAKKQGRKKVKDRNGRGEGKTPA